MLKVKIIKEVYSEKQRRYFCASDDPELKAMCDDPMKEEHLEEMSAAGAGGAQGGVGVFKDEDEIRRFNEEEKKKSKLKGQKLGEEQYSTTGLKPGDGRTYDDEGANDGRLERAAHQKLRVKENYYQKWKNFLNS